MSWCCACIKKTYEAPEVTELNFRHFSLKEVPPEVFTNERTLEKLDLGSNQISDLPPSLFHCHELRELNLSDNELVNIPPAIGSLTRLYKLDMSRNAIAEIADTIKNCKNLIYLDLSLNQVQKIPDAISQLVNLEDLFLNDTYLEFLNANFGRLTKLKVLELRENSVQTLPKSMNRLINLQRLDIGQNDLFELPEVIGTMTNLVELWCDNNGIQVLSKFIGNLTKLTCLDVSRNDINHIAEEISRCTQLNDITLSSNKITFLPESFSKLENVSVLRLDGNSIQYLPEDFGKMKNLQELSLINNSMKFLPASFGLLKRLHTLYLDDNVLTELPKEIGNCSALSVLSLSKNRLLRIPTEIGELSNLKVFSLAGNLLSYLPISILKIPKLGALWLSESQSKPLPQLNKEVLPESGEQVLTCYLLPQVPLSINDVNTYNDKNNSEEVLKQERSKPTIKFLSDQNEVIVPVENNLDKRVLLRAPTPYPKELRALAKHASHIRQSRDLTSTINTDEPEYDGDFPLADIQDGKNQVEETSAAPEYKLKPSINYYDASQNQNQSQKSQKPPPDEIKQAANSQKSEQFEPKATHVPPPYHIAAQRAAFFRQSNTQLPPLSSNSSTTITSTSINDILLPQSQSQPQLSVKPLDKPEHRQNQNQQNHNDLPLANENTNQRNSYPSTSAVDLKDKSIECLSLDAKNPEEIAISNSTTAITDYSKDKDKNEQHHQPVFEVQSNLPETKFNNNRDDLMIMNTTTSSQINNKSFISDAQNNEVASYDILINSLPKLSSNNELLHVENEAPQIYENLQDPPIPTPTSPMAVLEENNQISNILTSNSNSTSQLPLLKVKPTTSMSKIPVFGSMRSSSPPKPAKPTIPTSQTHPENMVIGLPQVNSQNYGSISSKMDTSSINHSHSMSAFTESSISASAGGGKVSSISKLPESTSKQYGYGSKVHSDLTQQNVTFTSDLLKDKDKPTISKTNLDSSKIPRFGSGGKGPAKFSQIHHQNQNQSQKEVVQLDIAKSPPREEPPNPPAVAVVEKSSDINTGSFSRIPKIGSGSGKKWIFGTHTNARVLRIDYKKIGDNLGFSVSQGFPGIKDQSGIYITKLDTDLKIDTGVLIGDKLIEIDSINVTTTPLEIVQKILSNCQETITLLISRQSST